MGRLRLTITKDIIMQIEGTITCMLVIVSVAFSSGANVYTYMNIMYDTKLNREEISKI